jgi:16S rRNA (uracil1498-N3)-methyltransferase
MHRFYIPPEDWIPDALTLTGNEAHHCRDVLRMKRGDKAVLFNGRGHEITAEIIKIDNREVRFRKLHGSETPPWRCRISLGQAIPKGKNMDLIVQKAVEIGASEIAPLISERTIVDLDAKDAAQKKAKWEQVAIEAAKQCGQNWLPQVHAPRKLKDFFAAIDVAAVSDRRSSFESKDSGAQRALLQQNAFDLRLIGSLQSDAQHLKKILAEYSSEHRHLPTSILMATSLPRNWRSRKATAAAPSRSARSSSASRPPRSIVSAFCRTSYWPKSVVVRVEWSAGTSDIDRQAGRPSERQRVSRTAAIYLSILV